MLKNQIVMTNYLSLQELVTKIEKNISQLEAGMLQTSDLELHTQLVRELYERTLILRYKAFEKSSNVEIASKTEENIEEVQTATKIEETPTSVIEEIEPVVEEKEVVAPVATEIEFDFFSTTENTEIAFEQPEEKIIEEPITETPTFTTFSEPIQESSVEQIPVENPFSVASTIEEEEKIEENVEVPLETTNAISNPTQPSISPENLSNTTNKVEQKIAQIKSKMNSQLGYYTISSLIGSFGLNERLLYINELFDGSSESFSDAIKQLDAKTNLSDATIFTTELVNKFNWDIESETVEEFFQKLCRRYA